MNYAETETKLIQAATSWRESANYQRTASSDNTPFEQFDEFRARAIMTTSGWMFKAIVRSGYSGESRANLADSLAVAQKERQQWIDEMTKEREARERGLGRR